MLLEVRLDNFILVRKERISFAGGLNIISGPSGAGKTIIVKALHLLSGERAASGLIGPFGKNASVEGYFRLPPGPARAALREASPLAEDEEGEVAALRTVGDGGDNRCYLNGRAVTLQAFRTVTAPLLEISGQEGFLSLAGAAPRAALLDRFGRLEGLSSAFAALLAEIRGLEARLAKIKSEKGERRDRIDFLRFQAGEIGKLNLEKGETARLEEEHRLLSDLDRVRDTISRGRMDLYESEGSILDRLGALLHDIESFPGADSGRIADCSAAIRRALSSVEEAAFLLRELAEDLNADPERLAAVEERLLEIHDALRRDGPTEADLFDRLDRIESELDRIDLDDDKCDRLGEELEEKKKKLSDLGRRIHDERYKAGGRLAAAVRKNLARLLMKDVRFRVALDEPDWSGLSATATPSGPSAVRFTAATNPGSSPAPVERIASGGERSRLLLALLCALGKSNGTSTMVFDEIDENVGARMGHVVGNLLQDLGRNMQVIAVTHIPALAAWGERHHKVEKNTAAGKTMVTVRKLEGTERARELAEMAAGPSPSEKAVREAQRTLKDFRET